MRELLDEETLSAVMRAVASKRRRQDTACAVCGAELHNVPRKRRYCTNRCAQRASRERRRAQEAAG